MARKISSDVRFYYGGYDPGLSTTTISVTLNADPLDATALPDVAERAIAGIRKDSVEYAGLFDDQAQDFDQAQAALLATGTAVLSVLFGTVLGDVAYSGTAWLLAAKNPAAIGDLVKQEAVFKPDLTMERGVVSTPKITITTTGTTGSVDNTGSTTAGGNFYLHVFGYTGGGTGRVALRHAGTITGTSWSDIGTVVGITGTSSFKTAISGTIAQYTRVEGTGTSFEIAGVLVRS